MTTCVCVRVCARLVCVRVQRPVPAHAQLALPQSAAQNRGRVGIVIGGAGAQGAVNVSNTGNASKNSRQGPPAQQPPER